MGSFKPVCIAAKGSNTPQKERRIISMSFIFENQGSGSHLVYELSSEEELDTMSLGMLSNNKIPGLIPLLFTRMNLTEYIKYNVSSKISVKQFFTGTVNKKQLLGVFRGIAEAMISAEEYMINPDNIILDTEYIFSDVSTCETALVCLPVKGAVNRVDLKSFFRDIMFNTQFDQTENCDHVAKIINYLNSSAVFSVYEFKKLLDKLVSSSEAPDISQVRASVPQIRQEQNPVPNMQNPQNVPYRAAQNQAPVINHAASPAPTASPTPQAPVSTPAARANSKPVPMPNQVDQGMAIPMANQSSPKMAVPGMKAPNMPAPNSVSTASSPSEQTQQDNGEKIGLMYLLQHYNKENAEKYKAQKKAKKAAKQQSPIAAPTAVNAPNMPNVPNFQGAGSPAAGNGMAFPGQNGSVRPIPTPMNTPKPVSSAPSQSPQPMHAAVPAPVAPVRNDTPMNREGFADFGDTQYIQQSDEDSETAFLMPGIQNDGVQPYLQAKRNNERIPINGNIFRLGRDKDFNDYVIQNNKFVGHSHCHILVENGEYFIVDDNSKNRTYVDGTPIQPGVKIKLVHGQNIKLADEEFEFRIF